MGRTLLPIASATLLCLVATAALASSPGETSLGALAGYQFTSADGELIDEHFPPAALDHAVWMGLRTRVAVTHGLAMEATAALLPLSTRTDARTALGVTALLEADAHVTLGSLTLHLAAGGGTTSLVRGELGRDDDLVISAGTGFHWHVPGQPLVFRCDAKALLSDGVDESVAMHFAILVGLDVKLNAGPPQEEAHEPADRDTDGDGLPDVRDACPAAAGPRPTSGCPDADRDGMADRDDACPESAGSVAYHGCPDTDGDGVPDTTDGCPTLPGDARFHGCPDGDGDGIPDGEDRCPGQAGSADTGGCPAPPPEVLELFGRPLDGLVFARDAPGLMPESGAVLSRIAHGMAAFSHLRVEVQGHTHGRIRPSLAKPLTLARATAVVSALVELGVDPRRLTAVGLGSDHPIATNRTRAGRRKNTRIELRLVNAPAPAP